MKNRPDNGAELIIYEIERGIFFFDKTTYASTGYVQGPKQEENTNATINSLESGLQQLITDPDLEQYKPFDNRITAKDLVLKRCQQIEPKLFEECYPNCVLKNCHKIGEGVYGEVFLYKKPSGEPSAIKIIPIENDLIVNGVRQKTYEEVLTEITISLELSELRNNQLNQTTSFVQVQQINCVIGRYPEKLIDLWHLYDETKGSSNDSPEIFPDHQLYIVLELNNAGQDIELFVFNNAQQALSMFQQVACALAVAENELKFEHRDLHWGNVLIKKVDTRKTIQFVLNGQQIEINSYGIEVTIIDYTFSRAEFQNVVVYNDLSQEDGLFHTVGDYQFDVYRMMQQANRNNWEDFQPQSNLFWLHYLLKKMIDVDNGLNYMDIKTKVHREHLKKILELEAEILNYCSVVDFVQQKFVKYKEIC